MARPCLHAFEIVFSTEEHAHSWLYRWDLNDRDVVEEKKQNKRSSFISRASLSEF